MLWIEAFHVIAMVAWFSALFYLPRLFVYHAMSDDAISIERFKVMERKLYYAIMTTAGIITTLLGSWLLSLHFQSYMQQGWMHAKLSLVVLLWAYHLYCGKIVKDFKHDRNKHSHVFYRWFNEVPTVLLAGIIILVVVKP